MFVGSPAYPADDADRQTVVIAGLRLPLRATIAIAVTTFVLLFDYSRTFLPELVESPPSAVSSLIVGGERIVLFGVVPAAVIVLGFRDRLPRYGLTLGDWRAGVALIALGLAVMIPVVLWFATLPDARTYYAPVANPLLALIVANALDLSAAEFLFRGFLMLTLIRAIGPIGVLVAAVPFVMTHLGKPELELFSTLGGGTIYGWLAWRTGSIVWGAAAHIVILTLVSVAAAGAAA